MFYKYQSNGEFEIKTSRRSPCLYRKRNVWFSGDFQMQYPVLYLIYLFDKDALEHESAHNMIFFSLQSKYFLTLEVTNSINTWWVEIRGPEF